MPFPYLLQEMFGIYGNQYIFPLFFSFCNPEFWKGTQAVPYEKNEACVRIRRGICLIAAPYRRTVREAGPYARFYEFAGSACIIESVYRPSSVSPSG